MLDVTGSDDRAGDVSSAHEMAPAEPTGRADGAPTRLTLTRRLQWTGELVRVLAPRELRSRYRQSVLDIAWALITPISVLVIYGIVLTQSFDVTGNGVPYLSLAWSGLVLWTFFASALGGAAVSLIFSADLITKVYFPKEAIPLSVAGASLADLGIGLLTVAILVPIQGVRPGWISLVALLPIVVLLVWTAALSILAGVVAAFVRDVPHLVQVVLRVGFLATPVMYDSSTLPTALRWSATVSPIAVTIEAFRDAVLRNVTPRVGLLLIHLAVGVALLAGSVVYARAVESRLADVV